LVHCLFIFTVAPDAIFDQKAKGHTTDMTLANLRCT